MCFSAASDVISLCGQVILLLVIIAMWKRLKLVVALFHEAGKCVIAMPLLLIQPVWTFIVLIAFVAYWLVVLAFIGTSGESVSESSPSSPTGSSCSPSSAQAVSQ